MKIKSVFNKSKKQFTHLNFNAVNMCIWSNFLGQNSLTNTRLVLVMIDTLTLILEAKHQWLKKFQRLYRISIGMLIKLLSLCCLFLNLLIFPFANCSALMSIIYSESQMVATISFLKPYSCFLYFGYCYQNYNFQLYCSPFMFTWPYQMSF